MGRRVSIDGLADAVMQELDNYADTTADGVKAAVKKAANTVKKEISAGAPERTGRYAKSWRTKTTKESSSALEITVYSPTRYMLAHLLEHGRPPSRTVSRNWKKRSGGRFVMDNLISIMEEIGIPFAYDHFAEGESPEPPFICFLCPGSDNFAADGWAYFKVDTVHIELYTDEKNPGIESRVEAVLDRRGIFFEKTEVWIESERLYEVLYSFELEVKTNEQ